MSRNISEGRKTAYYLGMVIMVIGLGLFLSVFFSMAGLFNSAGAGGVSGGGFGMIFGRAIGGIVLLIVGGAIRGIGAMGAAGSGLVLDPEQAREDLEPYTRMAGGMVKDVLDEAEIDLGGRSGRGSQAERVIMIKCRQCRTLNEDGSKFCQECGQAL